MLSICSIRLQICSASNCEILFELVTMIVSSCCLMLAFMFIPFTFYQDIISKPRKRLFLAKRIKNLQIPAMRLYFQRVSSQSLSSPLEIVKWLGAVQAQDYSSALWSLGLRLPDARLATVEAVLSQKQIIRTWSLRGTLHFLPAEDVRWMLSLVAPGAKARFAKDCAQQGLDEAEFSKIFKATEKVLQGKALSRKVFMAALAGEGINTEGRNASLI